MVKQQIGKPCEDVKSEDLENRKAYSLGFEETVVIAALVRGRSTPPDDSAGIVVVVCSPGCFETADEGWMFWLVDCWVMATVVCSVGDDSALLVIVSKGELDLLVDLEEEEEEKSSPLSDVVGWVFLPDDDTAWPDDGEPNPDVCVTWLDDDVAEPDDDVAEPDDGVTEPDDDVAEPDDDVAEPDDDVAEPDDCMTNPDDDMIWADDCVACPGVVVDGNSEFWLDDINGFEVLCDIVGLVCVVCPGVVNREEVSDEVNVDRMILLDVALAVMVAGWEFVTGFVAMTDPAVGWICVVVLWDVVVACVDVLDAVIDPRPAVVLAAMVPRRVVAVACVWSWVAAVPVEVMACVGEAGAVVGVKNVRFENKKLNTLNCKYNFGYW